MKLFDQFFRAKNLQPVRSEREQVLDHHMALARVLGVELMDDVERGIVTVTSGSRRFHLAGEYFVCAADFVNQFDYYFSTVEPVSVEDYDLQDFSKPGWHYARDGRVLLFHMHR